MSDKHGLITGWVPHRPDTWTARYGELKRDTDMEWYQGIWVDGEPLMKKETLPAGTTVKIVMVSRFGDIGITDKLGTEHGYGARLDIDDLDNLRATP